MTKFFFSFSGELRLNPGLHAFEAHVFYWAIPPAFSKYFWSWMVESIDVEPKDLDCSEFFNSKVCVYKFTTHF